MGRAVQLPLFDVRSTNNGFRDPAFADNKSLPIHRWVPWIAGFSAQFVDDVISTFMSRRKSTTRPCVLDPFAGVGTTLVQAMIHGFDAVGFEINPYAALASRMKLKAPLINLTDLHQALGAFREAASKWTSSATTLRYQKPAGFKTRIPFFSQDVEWQVLAALEFINSIDSPDIRDLFRLAFGAVMVSFSNYSYEPSLGTRPGAGKPLVEKANVASILLAKLRQMASDIRWIQEELSDRSEHPRCQIFNEDFMDSLRFLPRASVDLMVTSPPYMNNYHYVRNTRPQLFWLGFVHDSSELRKLEQANFGKFWQTVRNAPPVELEFEHQELIGMLEQLRNVRADKGPYGGPGWANYVTTYFNDCCRFLNVLKQVLRRRGVGVIVIGNSIIQGLEIKTEVILGEMAEQQGFVLEGIHLIRGKRVGSSITQSSVRRGKLNQAMLYESAVIVRKK